MLLWAWKKDCGIKGYKAAAIFTEQNNEVITAHCKNTLRT
jgi:hypothetical protein